MPHILLLDDDADALRSMASELSSEFEVLGGRSADDFVRLAALGEPIAVVSDLHMGAGPSGAAVLTEVKRRWPRAARVIVAGSTSGYALTALGVANVFVNKPWSPGALLRTVHLAIDEARGAVPARPDVDARS